MAKNPAERRAAGPRVTRANSVFINCPFDDEYEPFFRALFFTVQDCGFAARCAKEIQDDGETRSDKIVRLIRDCRYGIHDISRTELNEAGLPRFNMPYELGVFIGFRYSGSPNQRDKRVMVLDREPHRYQAFLSDYAGQDIHCHEGDIGKLITQVRHWLQGWTKRPLLGAELVRGRFDQFNLELPEVLAELRITESDLFNFLDYRRVVAEWIAQSPPEPV